MSTEKHRIFWNERAQQFRQLGPPLRPSGEDIRVMETAVADWYVRQSHDGLRALLCGVTPEIADMTWPPGTELLAVDQSEAMIRCLWPGDIDAWRQAECGNWLTLPQPEGWFDVVVGDGCFSGMSYPDGYRALAASIHRVLKNQGILIIRFFVRPEVGEPLQDLFSALTAGRIGSFHAFKWRLATVLQPSSKEGVRLGDIWKTWVSAEIDKNTLMATTGWPEEAINTIAQYEGQDIHWWFPTLKEVRAILLESFEEIAVYVAGYELAERCPIVVIRPV
jgi:SAM-dependent methyltransferase